MKIITSPNPVLRQVAQEIKSYDKKLERLIQEMTQALKAAHDPEGVGLAAPQVGVSKRLFLLNLHNKIEVIINPKIVERSEATLSQVYKKKKDRWLEGCLSLPKIWGFVDRPYTAVLKYLTPHDGKLITKERKFEGVESSYALHELDHLDGILFSDRILEQGGTLFYETPDGLSPIDKI